MKVSYFPFVYSVDHDAECFLKSTLKSRKLSFFKLLCDRLSFNQSQSVQKYKIKKCVLWMDGCCVLMQHMDEFLAFKDLPPYFGGL